MVSKLIHSSWKMFGIVLHLKSDDAKCCITSLEYIYIERERGLPHILITPPHLHVAMEIIHSNTLEKHTLFSKFSFTWNSKLVYQNRDIEETFFTVCQVGWLGWVLWHIKLDRLFNAKSTFIQINVSISNNSV